MFNNFSKSYIHNFLSYEKHQPKFSVCTNSVSEYFRYIKNKFNENQFIYYLFCVLFKENLLKNCPSVKAQRRLACCYQLNRFVFNQTASSTEKVSDLLFVMFLLSSKMKFNFIHIKNIHQRKNWKSSENTGKYAIST